MTEETNIEKIQESPQEDSKKTEQEITIKKSTYNNMIRGIVVVIAITAFVGGYSLGSLDNSDSGISSEELKAALSNIQAIPPPQTAQAPLQPNTPSTIMISLDDDPVKGNPNAPLTIVEFSDFQCPFCSRFYEQTLSQIEENYIDTGKVKFVYRDLPLDNLHPNARPAHIAAECADEQGKFWEYHDVLFEKQSEWNRLPSPDLQTTLTQYATDIGLQSTYFETCLNSQDIADEVNNDSLDAARYGATGTPTFFIGTEKDGFVKLSGAQPFSSFQLAIDSQLNS
jgi:protein-disulfide isomerase